MRWLFRFVCADGEEFVRGCEYKDVPQRLQQARRWQEEGKGVASFSPVGWEYVRRGKKVWLTLDEAGKWLVKERESQRKVAAALGREPVWQ